MSSMAFFSNLLIHTKNWQSISILLCFGSKQELVVTVWRSFWAVAAEIFACPIAVSNAILNLHLLSILPSIHRVRTIEFSFAVKDSNSNHLKKFQEVTVEIVGIPIAISGEFFLSIHTKSFWIDHAAFTGKHAWRTFSAVFTGTIEDSVLN